ncbi:MAG: hypothetical protein JWN44_6626 [Myxococcales bacterium]|nr:hypothetical protein [Myxococcales bacterium]
MSGRALLALAVAFTALAVAENAARAEDDKRYEGALFSFRHPAAATVQPGADPSADVAVTVTLKEVVASVLAGQKRVSDGEIEALATAWHGARIKNRAAWGMKANGGPPRDAVRIADRRWLRWRDHIGSVLGAQEQTMTCGAVGGHLACVVVSAPQKEREQSDALAAQLLGSLTIVKKH